MAEILTRIGALLDDLSMPRNEHDVLLDAADEIARLRTMYASACHGRGEFMDAFELADKMLDAISYQAQTCLARASNASLKADRAESLEACGSLSEEGERWRVAYEQLRQAQRECQRIFDEAVAELQENPDDQ